MQTLEQKYRKEIGNWNWDKIVADAKDNPREDFDGNRAGYFFLGTVFGLTPSGKFYTPFACSNVALCPFCKGDGTLKVSRPRANEAVYFRGKPVGVCLSIGGVHFKMQPYFDEAKGGIQEPINVDMTHDEPGDYRFSKTCTACGGVGSVEAYRDEVFREVLEEIAEKHHGWIENGEGDPCDMFFCISLDEDSTKEGNLPESLCNDGSIAVYEEDQV
jgi:hypothetical protein